MARISWRIDEIRQRFSFVKPLAGLRKNGRQQGTGSVNLLIPVLCALLLLSSALWMFQGLGEGNRAFILQLRLVKLGGLITVGAAIGVATVLFQTVAANRVLTPSLMGFDALFILIQTLLVATLGIAGFAALPNVGKFFFETALLSLLASILFGTLLIRGARDIPRTILTGIILGVMFRSLSGFLARVMDPNEFATVQSASFASFNHIDKLLLPWALTVTIIALLVALKIAPKLDILALGRATAISLGLRFDRIAVGTLALVAVLVSVSTALVGPVSFFGLIVAGLAHGLASSRYHTSLLPTAALIAATILVAGQFLFERLLGQNATLSVVIEFAGGLFFLFLLLTGRIR